ncbi:hypothetical protein B6U74_02295 [Candidatus Bathyarchaeota archaeon ex4484_205]|nr:MAG: hypothetical protein B6U74_02295 [Candidatus Bathyarchaeota archaeon ex4484_205]
MAGKKRDKKERDRVRSEYHTRIPRMVFNAIIAFFVLLLSSTIPPMLEGVEIPGIQVEPFNKADWLMWVSLMLIALIFAVRLLYDLMSIMNVTVDLFFRRGKVKPAKRIVSDITYILLTIVVAAAVAPLLGSIRTIGTTLQVGVSLLALGLIAFYVYDIGRTIYEVVESKADWVADWLAAIAENLRRKEEKGGSKRAPKKEKKRT